MTLERLMQIIRELRRELELVEGIISVLERLSDAERGPPGRLSLGAGRVWGPMTPATGAARRRAARSLAGESGAGDGGRPTEQQESETRRRAGRKAREKTQEA